MMRILGIDPGSLTTGYGIIESAGQRLTHIDNGIIRPKRTADNPDRLAYIYEGLVARIAEFRPTMVAIEEIFVAKNIRSALHLGQARGIALLAARQASLPIQAYSARTVKQSLVGNGNATKAQVQFMTAKFLQLSEPAAEDAADALAIAITHAHHSRGW